MATPASALRTRPGSWSVCASTTRPAPTASAASPSTRTGPGRAARPRLPTSASVSIPDGLGCCCTSSPGTSCPSCTCSVLGWREGLYPGYSHSLYPMIVAICSVHGTAPTLLPRAEAPPKALSAEPRGPSGSSDSSARQVLTHPPASPPACNCSGRSEECFYDRELFRSSGHGGHCRNCRDNTAGPHCESCRQNYYRWEPQGACQPCHCHPAGAWGCAQPGSGCQIAVPAGVCWEGWVWWILSCSGFPHLARLGLSLGVPTGSLKPQCDNSGTCVCKANVTGWKCERCKDGYHSLSEGGCR